MYTDEVTNVEKQEDGSIHVTIQRSHSKSDPPHPLVYGVSSTGVTRVANWGMEYEKPPLLVKLPAEVGTSWESEGTNYEVVGVEEVKVGAGKYKATKVETMNKCGKSTLWFAPGVGLVKSASEGSDTTLELKAFKPGK